MTNQYWARKAIKIITAAYWNKAVTGEILGLGNQATVTMDGILLNLFPSDTDPLAKAIALYGEPDAHV